MNTEDIRNAVCGIDEKYLAEFDKTVSAGKAKRNNRRKLLISAACFALISVCGLLLYKNALPGKTPDITQTQTPGTTAGAAREDDTLISAEENETANEKKSQTESLTGETETAGNKTDAAEKENTTAQATPSGEDGNKGGDTPDLIANYRKNPSDGCYYRVFHPATDIFDPLDEMTLENRFCSFRFNGKSYYPAPDGDIKEDDYEPETIGDARAESWEIRGCDENGDIKGIIYAARMDIYKLKNTSPDEAVAVKISFCGETKMYKYLCKPVVS